MIVVYSIGRKYTLDPGGSYAFQYVPPMIEILKDVEEWLNNGKTSIVIAVLIDINGSAVRGRGAVMAVTPDGLMTGSVSGGCIESSVLSSAERVFETGQAETIKFCQIDDPVLGSVSPCGGEVTVFIGKLDLTLFKSFCNIAELGKGGKWGLISSGPYEYIGSMFVISHENKFMDGSFNSKPTLPKEIKVSLENGILCSNNTGIQSVGNFEIFSTILRPVSQLVIVGASHIGIVLSNLAEQIGYKVIVIDPRASFARGERFSDKTRLLNTWPRKAFKTINFSPYTAIAVITHDTKIDDQALSLAMKRDNFYIGALGSSATHKDRVERLKDLGISEAECNKIHSPIGLNIKSANPEEIALSIMAELVKEFRERYGKY